MCKLASRAKEAHLATQVRLHSPRKTAITLLQTHVRLACHVVGWQARSSA